MTVTAVPTRRARGYAAHWSTQAACQGTDTEAFFDDTVDAQRQAMGVCRGCPARTSCLSDALAYEADGYMKWGVAGGLTPIQRRALRVDGLLGNTPSLTQARRLASPQWAPVMAGLRKLPPVLAVEELRRHGELVSPVTVRVALWWTGGKGSLLLPKAKEDRRHLWEQVRDESRAVVEQLRGMELGNRDIAAYLGVSEDALSRAVTVWRAQDAKAVEAVKAA